MPGTTNISRPLKLRLNSYEKSADRKLRNGEPVPRPADFRNVGALVNKERRKINVKIIFGNPLAAPVEHGEGDD